MAKAKTEDKKTVVTELDKRLSGVNAPEVFIKGDGTDWRLNEARARVLWGSDYKKVINKK